MTDWNSGREIGAGRRAIEGDSPVYCFEAKAARTSELVEVLLESVEGAEDLGESNESRKPNSGESPSHVREEIAAEASIASDEWRSLVVHEE